MHEPALESFSFTPSWDLLTSMERVDKFWPFDTDRPASPLPDRASPAVPLVQQTLAQTQPVASTSAAATLATLGTIHVVESK
jgi:hypothetical protein